MSLTNTTLIKFIIVFGSLELFYNLFGFIPREKFNAVYLLLTLSLSFFLIYRIRFLLSHFAFFSFSVFLVFLSSLNAYYNFGSFIWVGSFIKLILYLSFCFYLYTNQSRVELLSLLKFTFRFVLAFIALSIMLGLLMDNTQILNGRIRFQGVTYTSSLFSMFCGLCTIFFMYYLKVTDGKGFFYKIFIFFCICACLGLCFLSGSRQPFYGLILSMLLVLILNLNVFYRITLLFIVMAFVIVNFDFLYQTLFFLYDIAIAGDYLTSLSGIIDGSSYSRLRYLVYGVNYLLDNGIILIGSGLNTFPEIYYTLTMEERPAPHNLILMVVVNYGLLGCILFFTAVMYYFKVYRNKSLNLLLMFYFLFGVSFNNPEYFTSVMIFFILLHFLFCKYYDRESSF